VIVELYINQFQMMIYVDLYTIIKKRSSHILTHTYP